jgi:hypothetical protein
MIQHPESLYRAVQRGEDVKSFLLDLHRRNTGPLKRIEQNTEGIRMQDIADMPTMMMPSIPKSPDLTTEKLIACILVPSGMYVDQEGRMCLKLIDLEMHTIDLADLAVDRFRGLTGFYPDELVSCPSRYARLGNALYFPQGKSPIPFVRSFVFPVDYDILARGYIVL